MTWQVGVPPGPGRLDQPRGQHVSLAFPSGSLCGDGTGVCYLLPVLDTVCPEEPSPPGPGPGHAEGLLPDVPRGRGPGHQLAHLPCHVPR